jgi:hypothetical protein
MSNSFLKDWLHRASLTQADKLLVVLSTFDGPVTLAQIMDRAESAGVKRKQWANPSATLSRTKGLAIHTGAGWEITDSGRQKLANDGLVQSGAGVINVAIELRRLLEKVEAEDVVLFLNEAVRAYELGLYRSAVVMSWLAAVYVLQNVILNTKIDEFNLEARRINSNWKNAKNTDDFGRMKESEFLDRLVTVGLIGANVKASLKECLDRRNACGHPNSYKIGQNMTAAHVETLLLNVFRRFP